MKSKFKYIFPVALALMLSAGFTTSCTDKLDVTPISPKINTNANINALFEKCYANLAMAGMGNGKSGDEPCDIAGYSDAGMTGLIRQMWNVNELTTDEAVCSWGDGGLTELNTNTYSASSSMVQAYYSRLTVGITFCNQYLEEFSNHDATMTAEVRFVRALQYYLLLDAFGNIPFTTTVGQPKQITSKEAYEWLVQELNDIEPSLMDAKAKTSSDSNYGRADKAACWMLLMRLYLNAEVYTGTPQWEKAKEYAQKVIDSKQTAGYDLNTTGANGWTAYQMLFMGDNGESSAAKECIFPIYQDGKTTVSYGNSTFLVASCFNADMHANPKDLNGTNGLVSSQWAGNRAKAQLVKKFFPNGDAPHVQSYEMTDEAGDDRAIFCGEKHQEVCDTLTAFSNGFGVAKFVAYKSDGSSSKDPAFSDGDFFFFRVAEAYLTYAECDARLNGGTTTAKGTDLINKLRDRAHATQRTNTNYTLSDILDEWSREFYFEGRRRTDLIRFGKYSGNANYNWEFKGNVKAGKNIEAYRKIFAIPASDLLGAKYLKQNPGY